MYRNDSAWGHGVATVTADGTVLDVWYPAGHLGLGSAPASRPGCAVEPTAGRALGLRTRAIETVVASLADAPVDAADVYLRLHLLSHRMIRPNQANLDGVFGLLANNAWTSAGPCPPDRVDELRWATRTTGRPLTVYSIDFFPPMTDYVVPSGVRIADANRVRLGAHLAPGTTVLQEGLVGFNAGTLGRTMVEGRISSRVVVGEDSDIGGGASLMGTLSGGGRMVVSIGKRCLIGANGGVGISLGDDCVVEAGCYVTAGAKVTMADGRVVKANTLSGRSDLRFWRNSVTGALEASRRHGASFALNAAAHVA